MRRILLHLLVLLMVLSSVGCSPNRFSPVTRNLALRTVAIHSLLGTSGPRYWERVEVLEEDDFGRVMFAFSGGTVLGDEPFAGFNLLAVLIAQRIPESFRYAYFYDGINFIVHQLERGETTDSSFLTEAFVMERFTEAQLEQLKEENDWDKELNEDRFFRVPVSWREKDHYMTNISDQALEDAVLLTLGGFRPRPLTMDVTGNVIFFVRGASFDRHTSEWTFFPSSLLMFDRDGNLIEGTGVMELEDLWDYRDQLREFKEANGWSFYYRDVGEAEAVW